MNIEDEIRSIIRHIGRLQSGRERMSGRNLFRTSLRLLSRLNKVEKEADARIARFHADFQEILDRLKSQADHVLFARG